MNKLNHKLQPKKKGEQTSKSQKKVERRPKIQPKNKENKYLIERTNKKEKKRKGCQMQPKNKGKKTSQRKTNGERRPMNYTEI